MTLPRWVGPDPPDGGAGDTGDAGEAAGATGGEDLNVKPVLDWTNDDWARWIDSTDTYLPPREPAEGPAVAEPGEDEETFEPEPVVQDEARTSSPEDLAVASWDEEVRDDLDLWTPASEPAGVVGPEPSESPLVAVPEPIEQELEPTGEWILEPKPKPVDPAASAESTGPWTDEEWAAVAEHPWWESAPEPDPATARVIRVQEPDEPGAPKDLGALPPLDARPTTLPPPPLEPVAESRPTPAPRITRPRPAPAVRPSAPARMAADVTHRVRSAFGLLGVSLLIGTVMAGLITVILFALSLALRRAVG